MNETDNATRLATNSDSIPTFNLAVPNTNQERNNSDKTIVNRLINHFLISYYFAILFFIFFVLFQIGLAAYFLCLAIDMVKDIYYIHNYTFQLKSSTLNFSSAQYKNEKKQIKLLLTEVVFYFITKIQLIILQEIFEQYYITLIGPLFLIFILGVQMFRNLNDDKECLTLISFTFILLRLFMLLGCLSVTLKLDHYCAWTWKETFWWTWIFLSISLVITLCIFLILFSKMIQLFSSNEISSQEIKSLTWCFMVSILLPGSIYLWLFATIEILDDHDQTKHKMFVLLGVLVFHLIIFSFFTIQWRKEIKEYFHQSMQDEDTDQIGHSSVNIQEPQSQRKSVKIPRILKKISATYFGIANQQDLQKKKAKPQLQILSESYFIFLNIKIGFIRQSKQQKQQNKVRFKLVGIQDMINISQYQDEKFKKKCNSVEIRRPNIEDESQERIVSISGQSCLVCFDKVPDSVLMDCGHGGLCYECAIQIWRHQGECFLCRNKIIQVLQIDTHQKQGPFLKVVSSTQMVQ